MTIAATHEGPLGIICGSGSIPLAVAAAVQRRGRQVMLFALRGFVDAQAVAAYPHCWIAIGQFGRFRRLARAEGCRDLVLVGGLVRPAIRQVRLDWATVVEMPRIIRAFRGGDDHLLTGIGRILEGDGFCLLGAHEVAPDITAPSGALGRHQPDAEAAADIARGFEMLAAMSPFDVGQAVVIGKGHVLAVEAAEGTDAMLQRVVALREAGRIRLPARGGRARQGAEAAPGPPFRFALDRARHGAPCGASRTRRHRRRRRRHHRRRAAAPRRGRRYQWPVRAGSRRSRGGLMQAVPSSQHRAADDALNIFIIAGEESGDRLGAPLMAAIAAQAGRPVVFSGVGGHAMAAQGLASLVPIADLAINGFAAIPGRLPAILRHLRRTTRAVIAARPDALVIIDSPDFTHRVARRVRAAAPAIPIIDYVSPTVWAWRPGRAAAMRRYVDHVLAVLPFEPDAHRRLGGPPCTYVGHPLAEQVAMLRPGPHEAARRNADPPVVLVLPGSRRGEVRRHIAVFGAAMAAVQERIGAVEIVLPTVPHLVDEVKRASRAWPAAPRIVVDAAEKWAAFRQARAALAASGTVTLELALAGVPTVIAYRVALFEELIARALVNDGHDRARQSHSRRENHAGIAAAGRRPRRTSPMPWFRSSAILRSAGGNARAWRVSMPSWRSASPCRAPAPPPSCSPWPADPARFHRRIRRANRNPKGIASAT